MQEEYSRPGVGDLEGAGRGIRPDGLRRYLPPILAILIIVIAGAIALATVSGEEREKILRAVIDGVLLGGVYAIVALGVVVVYKASKVFNLAHGGLLMLLAYVLWWLLASRGLPVWLSVILLLAAGMCLGWAIDRFLMRRMLGQSGLTTFIMTLVLGFSVIQGLTILLFKGVPQVMPRIFPDGYFFIGDVGIPSNRLYAFAVALAMFIVFVAYFRYTRSGLAMRSVSENPVVSQSLGINAKRIFTIAWVVGALSASVGALLLGQIFAIDSTLGSFALIRALPVLLLGGLESVPGVLIGALIVGVGETLAGTYIDPHIAGFRELVPYVLIVTILILRPHGLFGLREIRRI